MKDLHQIHYNSCRNQHADAKATPRWKYYPLVLDWPIHQTFHFSNGSDMKYTGQCQYSFLGLWAFFLGLLVGTHRRSGCWGSSYVPLRPDLALQCTASFHWLVHLGNSVGNNQAWVWKHKGWFILIFLIFRLRNSIDLLCFSSIPANNQLDCICEDSI